MKLMCRESYQGLLIFIICGKMGGSLEPLKMLQVPLLEIITNVTIGPEIIEIKGHDIMVLDPEQNVYDAKDLTISKLIVMQDGHMRSAASYNDTGATVNIIKSSVCPKIFLKSLNQKQVYIRSALTHQLEILGSTEITYRLGKAAMPYKIYVIEDKNLELECDGILSRNFLKFYKII